MTYIIAVCTVKKTPDDGQRNCTKNVEFQYKNKFEKISASIWFYYKKFEVRGRMEKSPNLARTSGKIITVKFICLCYLKPF